MSPIRFTLTLGAIIAVASLGIAIWLIVLTRPAPAAEVPVDLHSWYKSLKTASGGSCCDLSDCAVVDADFKNGQWWADVKMRGGKKWMPIPPGIVLSDKQEPDGKAVLCSSGGSLEPTQTYVPGGEGPYTMAPYDPALICFVPPVWAF